LRTRQLAAEEAAQEFLHFFVARLAVGAVAFGRSVVRIFTTAGPTLSTRSAKSGKPITAPVTADAAVAGDRPRDIHKLAPTPARTEFYYQQRSYFSWKVSISKVRDANASAVARAT
jgi:hypothetical protein